MSFLNISVPFDSQRDVPAIHGTIPSGGGTRRRDPAFGSRADVSWRGMITYVTTFDHNIVGL